jgi:2-amino-4-hydroxy-6-hydroxymethyldihydropteridine diphosphokinase
LCRGASANRGNPLKQTVYVGVGTNLDPEKNVLRGLELLMQRVSVVATSTFYWSDAIDENGNTAAQPPFLNGVLQLTTGMTPMQLKFDVLRPVEEMLGRVRIANRYADRPLDLDILLFENLVVDEPELRIPDRDIRKRAFVALPLLELAGNICLPGNDDLLGDVVHRLDTTCLRKNHGVTLDLRNRMTAKE